MFAEIHHEAFEGLPVVLNTVGESPRQSSINHAEGIKYHEFSWVMTGEGEFTVDSESFILSEGEGVFMRRNVPHSYHGEFIHTGWFTFSVAEGMLDYLGIPRYLRFTVPAFLNNENRALEAFSGGESTVLSRSSAGYAHVTELFSAILEVEASPEEKLRKYLEMHYGEPITLDEIAEYMGMNRYSVCRYYMKKRGITVMDELNKIRIAKAKRFLRYTPENIEKIGKMCGYESPSYFSKRFREATGKTPGEYRAESLKKA